jgi:two-component system LytT family response regulator
MDQIKALVIDDEEGARDVLTSLLKRSSFEFAWIKQGENVPQAVELIKKHGPDVVFIDVQMPKYAGYEIASFFDEMPCDLVFVTAFDKYAIKAFELSAVDYLVKPVERSRLYEALEKIQQNLNKKRAIENYQVLLNMVEKKELGTIVLSELSEGQLKKHIIPLKNILALEAMRAYTQVYLVDGSSLVVSRNMKQLEDRLPMEDKFFRSHRSWIVNTDHVKNLNLGEGELVLTNNMVTKFSKTCQKELEQRLVSSS